MKRTRASHASAAAAVVLAALAAVALSCSGQSGADPTMAPADASNPTPTPTAAPTADLEAQFTEAIAALTTNDLPALILPQRQLETFSDTLLLDARSGPVSNARAASRFPTTALSAQDLQNTGRLGGYLLAFDSPSFGAYSGGPASIEVGLELFRDDAGAAAYIQARWDELALSDPALEIDINTNEQFEITTHGESSGRIVTATYHAYASEIGVTTAVLRHDRLIAWIALTELNPFERSQYVARVLQVFEQRLQRIWAGELEAVAEHDIPDRLAAPAVPPPADSAPFDTMTLWAEDLLPHQAIVAEGYVADPGTLINYRRRITDNGLAKLTSWAPDGIDASVMNFPDASRISAHLDHWSTADSPDRVVDFGHQTGLQDPTVKVYHRDQGDRMLIVVGAGDHELFGRLTIAYVWVQSDSLLGELFAIGPIERLSSDHILQLADRAAVRFTAGIGSN